MERRIACSGSKVGCIEGNIAWIERSIGCIEGDIAWIERNIGCVEGDIAWIERSIGCISSSGKGWCSRCSRCKRGENAGSESDCVSGAGSNRVVMDSSSSEGRDGSDIFCKAKLWKKCSL
jgi:hypothetical protein